MSLISALAQVLSKQNVLERKVDRLLARHGDGQHLADIQLYVIAINSKLDQLIAAVGTAPEPVPATRAVLTFTQGENMAGAINVDTLNETVTLEFQDDHGNVTDAPAGVVVTFTSDNEAVATVAVDSANPLQGDVTAVGLGTANLSATLANADGSPVLEADGVTAFPVPAAVAVTVGPGPADTDTLVLSV